MKYFKKLVGERVYLSPRNSSDVEIFAEWLNDFGITDYIGRSFLVMTLDSEKKFLEDNATDPSQAAFSIVTLDEDKIIGTVSLEKIDPINRQAVFGIFIGDKEYHSQGYGTEATRLILDFGFNYLNLNNIRLDVLDVNERAIKAYKKAGFKEAGRIRKNRFINGKYYDTVVMDILAEEFNESYIKNKNI